MSDQSNSYKEIFAKVKYINLFKDMVKFCPWGALRINPNIQKRVLESIPGVHSVVFDSVDEDVHARIYLKKHADENKIKMEVIKALDFWGIFNTYDDPESPYPQWVEFGSVAHKRIEARK